MCARRVAVLYRYVYAVRTFAPRAKSLPTPHPLISFYILSRPCAACARGGISCKAIYSRVRYYSQSAVDRERCFFVTVWLDSIEAFGVPFGSYYTYREKCK